MEVELLIPLAAPFAQARFIEQLGHCAESRGFSGLWVGEHVVVPDRWKSAYPGSEDGRIPDAVQRGELDTFTTLTYLAAITERIRLGACCNVAQRNPVYTAKEAANVDWLSGGRLAFGAGVGWSSEEFEACGIPFERRGDRARCNLEVIRRLWSEPVAEYAGEFYSLPPSLLYPKPVQQPAPPIHCLGHSAGALRRVADFGGGFFPMDLEPADFARPLSLLDELLAQRGRSRGEIIVSVLPPVGTCDLDKVKRYRDAGVDRVVIMEFVTSEEHLQPVIDNLAERLVVPAASL